MIVAVILSIILSIFLIYFFVRVEKYKDMMDKEERYKKNRISKNNKKRMESKDYSFTEALGAYMDNKKAKKDTSKDIDRLINKDLSVGQIREIFVNEDGEPKTMRNIASVLVNTLIAEPNVEDKQTITIKSSLDTLSSERVVQDEETSEQKLGRIIAEDSGNTQSISSTSENVSESLFSSTSRSVATAEEKDLKVTSVSKSNSEYDPNSLVDDLLKDLY